MLICHYLCDVLILMVFWMKFNYVKLLINILIYTFFNISIFANAAENSIFLENYTTYNGLSDNHINDISKSIIVLKNLKEIFGIL